MLVVCFIRVRVGEDCLGAMPKPSGRLILNIVSAFLPESLDFKGPSKAIKSRSVLPTRLVELELVLMLF